MLPVIQQDLENVVRTIDGYQYQLDHTELISQMVIKIARFGVQGRLLLDKTNFYSSSCARQAARVNELFRAGCQLWICKPSRGHFACVHVKCFILDEEIVLTGSMNLTHNGMEITRNICTACRNLPL
jgi:phosphatidylserine/phosphatidylglycerophosphate/cardiolipin synthase-like enzyme